MDKYLIVTYNTKAKVSAITKSFNNESDMLKYIEFKTKAGIECHKFDYSETYHLVSQVVKSN